MTSYFGCVWHHDHTTDPVYIWTELDGDRRETRKVEQYPDGTRLRADSRHPDGGTSLSEVPVPVLATIEAQPDFTVEPLTADEFEAVWTTATYR